MSVFIKYKEVSVKTGEVKYVDTLRRTSVEDAQASLDVLKDIVVKTHGVEAIITDESGTLKYDAFGTIHTLTITEV